MRKELKGFLLGVSLTLTIGVAADGIWEKIDVQSNSIHVVVNGQKIDADNFLYNDTTYLPIRAVSEALGQKVDYEESTNTAYIGKKGDDRVSPAVSKYTPPADIINDDTSIYAHDGVYYAKILYVAKTMENGGYKFISFNEETNKLTMQKGDEEPLVIQASFLIGNTVIPYDDFVDNILPLIEKK